MSSLAWPRKGAPQFEELSNAAHRQIYWHMAFITLTLLALLAFGLANLYSAGAETYIFQQQVQRSIVGLVLFVLFGWVIPLRLVNTYAYAGVAVVVILLGAVMLRGHVAGGAQRWFSLGPIRFQPSELAKLALAIATAKFFYNSSGKRLPFELRDLGVVALNTGVVFALVFLQPDFGTAGICLLIVGMQILFIDLKIGWRTAAGLGVLVAAVGAVGWLFLLRDYQKLRVLNLLNPDMDPSGSGYNSLQSLIAIGSGGQWGKGFLQGTQSQLQFLPARHTDFAFAVFAEEHGFWVCASVFVLFFVMTYLVLESARWARDAFAGLLGIGVAALIFLQFVINVAMVLGLFPVVGIPLPFFSYGGTALIINCIGLGFVIAIDRDILRA